MEAAVAEVVDMAAVSMEADSMEVEDPTPEVSGVLLLGEQSSPVAEQSYPVPIMVELAEPMLLTEVM